MIANSELVKFLKEKTIHSGFIDQLKVSYRPLICPFDDLLNLLGDRPLSVLDIGCGSGQFALLLAEFTKVSRISGIEISEKLVANARELLSTYQHLKTDFHIYNGMDMPANAGEFDYIFLIDVLHHIPEEIKKGFLLNIYKGMRPGATFVLKDIDRASPWVFFNKMHDLIFSGEIGHEWALERTSAVAQEIGFTIVEKTKRRMYGYPHYTMVLSK